MPATGTETPPALHPARLEPPALGHDPRSKLRMLLIVNPKATTVSGRLKKLIVYALRGGYEVEARETEGPGHATALTREATAEGFDLVVAFGGDGTVNEAANGLAGSEVPLAMLPGGCTNVVCRMLGMPRDVVDATEHLLTLSQTLPCRSIDLGKLDGRYFVTSGGIGLDADTARWVDGHPPLKSRAGPFFFSVVAAGNFLASYAGRQPRLVVEAGDQRLEAITAVAQNCDPFTYFSGRPVRLCEGADIESGTLDMLVLRGARHWDTPALARRLLSRQLRVTDHPQVETLCAVERARVRGLERDGAPLSFPVQVDGDYIGHRTEIALEVAPRSLLVVA